MNSPINSKRAVAAARRSAVALCALTFVASACGSDAADTTPPSDSAPTTMSGMDMDTNMNMGDPDATPADEVERAALARGAFVRLDTRPQGHDEAAGSAVIARSTAGTTVTVQMTGLLPDVEYISHVHAEPCAPDNGGPHYQFEVGGATTPPNEIHLAFTSGDDGHGSMTVENHAIAGIEAQALVVHPAEFLDNKVACVDFVEDEPGAIADIIASVGEPDE